MPLTCAHGRPFVNPDWPGPHHCEGCAAEVEAACQAFDAAVARGEYDRWGYTPAEARRRRTVQLDWF